MKVVETNVICQKCLSYAFVFGSDITLRIKIDKPLVVYKFSNVVMTPYTLQNLSVYTRTKIVISKFF